jgi:hypothetical protein
MTIRQISDQYKQKLPHKVKKTSTGDVILLESPDWSGIWGTNQNNNLPEHQKYNFHSYDNDDYEPILGE